jgi:hypothetical protein
MKRLKYFAKVKYQQTPCGTYNTIHYIMGENGLMK